MWSWKVHICECFQGGRQYRCWSSPTDVVEVTMEPVPYPHPLHPNVTLWDLPGIGTTSFPPDQYLKYVEFEKLDFFIVVSAGRFRDNDTKLAQEIKKLGKKFYLVRSKIDNNLRDEQRDQREYDEEKTLRQIRESCVQGLEKQGMASPQVFLMSHFDLHLYDFPALHETMETELPTHKRDVLIMALPNVSSSIITKKKEVFSSQIKYYALLASGVTAVPVPGLSIAADLSFLLGVLQDYLNGMGLDAKSLEKLSSDMKKPLDDLRAITKCLCSGKDVTEEHVATMLRHSVLPTGLVEAEEGSRWIPTLGIPAGASPSFTSISMVLSCALNSLSVDAVNVLMESLDIQ